MKEHERIDIPPSKGEYDSKDDTIAHVQRVANLLYYVATELMKRAEVHDLSKLQSPEKEYFDKYTPLLQSSTYGSEEYNKHLDKLREALDHHYKHNSHHPEHYPDGINGMDLYDLIEMFMDWKAASERHDDGDIRESIRKNTERFEMSPQLVDIFMNTVKRTWG